MVARSRAALLSLHRQFAEGSPVKHYRALVAGRWGLPNGLSDRARRVIAQAGTLGEITTLALAHLQDATTLSATTARHVELVRLRREADRMLAEASCVAALHLAGFRGDDRD